MANTKSRIIRQEAKVVEEVSFQQYLTQQALLGADITDLFRLMMEKEGNTSGQKMVRSWSTSHYIVNSLDLVAARLKGASGVHVDRSKVMNIMAEILIERAGLLDFDAANDINGIKRVIQNALSRKVRNRKAKKKI